MSGYTSLQRIAAGLLPHGRRLAHEQWHRRHTAILALLWLHVLVVPAIAWLLGSSVWHMIQEAAPLAAAAFIAGQKRLSRRTRALATSIGLLTASAVLVHITGGLIEMHFHFFVIVPVIALYQNWGPFLAAVGYVLVHHGVMGAISPESVYNHPAAIASPWRWAAVHAFFIAGLCIVCLVTWRWNELALDQRERTQDSLLETLSVLSATLECTQEGILVANSQGQITNYNQRFLQMWDLPEELIRSGDDDAAIAMVLSQLTDPDAFVAKVRELYGDLDAESVDELTFNDGRVFERYSSPHRVDGVSVGRVWSFRDVTEQKSNERALLEAAKRDRETAARLESLDEAKTLLLTAVSHELRTPLQSITGFARILSQHNQTLDAAQRGDFLERLTRNAERLEGLVLDLFDIDRISRGILEPRRHPTDVLELIQRVLANLGAKDGRVTVDAERIVADIDPGMIERVVENLVANALKHTPVDTSVHVKLWSTEELLELAVEDDGPGIADGMKVAVFEPFQQAGTPSHAPGTGIGLTVVDRFIALHGGRSWVEDRIGGGACFRVSLPVAGAELVIEGVGAGGSSGQANGSIRNTRPPSEIT